MTATSSKPCWGNPFFCVLKVLHSFIKTDIEKYICIYMNIYIYYTVYIDFLLEQRKKGDRSFSTYSVRWCHDDASKSIVVFFAFQFNVNNVWYFLPFHFGSSKQAPAPLSTRSPFPSRQPQCHCPSRWKRPSCWLSWWLSWWLWWRLCCLWWRLCWARRLPMPRKSLPVRWGQNQSPPTLVLEAKASNTSVGAFFEDLVRVILATANMLKNHLPLVACATAFALGLPSWGCKTWEPRKCRFTAVASTHSTDSGWDRHTDGEKCSQAKKMIQLTPWSKYMAQSPKGRLI